MPSKPPTIEPPYFAVIFSAQRTSADGEGYLQAARRMEELAALQPGFLALETARDADGFGITVSYWRTEEDIARWKAAAEHAAVRELGRARWYSSYRLTVARVERTYDWQSQGGGY